jgi:mono/diheme cytochrome c family protein
VKADAPPAAGKAHRSYMQRRHFQVRMHVTFPALLLVAAYWAAWWPAASFAADRSAEGRAILQKRCSGCHAIEPLGASPLKTAPPMREIYGRYATRELQEELSEGMVSKHKAMPQISFSAEDVAAILAYLHDLARGR